MSQVILIREGRVTSLLRDISKPVRIFISFSACVTIFLTWALLLYVPANNKIEKFKLEIDALKTSNAASIKLAQDLPGLEKMSKEQLPFQEVVNKVFDLVRQNELSCKQFKPLEDKYSLILEGSYNNIVSFFQSVKKSNLRLSILDFYLVSSDKGSVELNMNIYIKGK